MKEYVLSYYPNFKCIAEKCKHTCCAGWEMNIDSDSLRAYKDDSTDFSVKLKDGINFKKSKFKADKFKRCAFLNDKGLCEIIINLGEQSLCQVCRDHPRFRSFFADRTETGLGFCCEEAARLILTYRAKIEPIKTSDDNANKELQFSQKNVLEFRKTALEILQDRAVSIDQRIDDLLKICKASVSEQDFKKILKAFLSLERLDKEWGKRLKSIKRLFNKQTKTELSLYCEQFLVNGLYRHLSDAEDTMWVRARAIACVISWWVIKSLVENEKEGCESLEERVIDAVRAYSAEVEYSIKNLDKLFSFCYKFIKI